VGVAALSLRMRKIINREVFRAAGVIMLLHNFELIICDSFVEKLLAIPKVHKRGEESSWLLT
jgi:hypothetical protein